MSHRRLSRQRTLRKMFSSILPTLSCFIGSDETFVTTTAIATIISMLKTFAYKADTFFFLFKVNTGAAYAPSESSKAKAPKQVGSGGQEVGLYSRETCLTSPDLFWCTSTPTSIPQPDVGSACACGCICSGSWPHHEGRGWCPYDLQPRALFLCFINELAVQRTWTPLQLHCFRGKMRQKATR